MDGDPIPAKPRRSRAARAPAPLGDLAVITIELDRASGRVTVHSEFSTPLETWAMLSQATAIAAAPVDQANGITSEPD